MRKIVRVAMGLTESRVWKSLLLICAVTLGFWTLDRRIPVDQVDHWVTNQPVVPGGVIDVKARVDRTRSCQNTTRRKITYSNGVSFDVAESSRRAPPGPMGEDTTKDRIDLPDSAPPGDASIEYTIRWSCNQIQVWFPITTVWSIPFKIGTLR